MKILELKKEKLEIRLTHLLKNLRIGTVVKYFGEQPI